ncbi:MAG: hypothetical protein IT379_39195 [Deltaproteobacteria bacterium]|nr:hypothetical protein [Deltaproteobacteria bacterium]
MRTDSTGRWAMAVIAAGIVAGCDAPEGIIRIHFELSPPAAVDFGAQDPPPIDPMAVSDAAGSIETEPAEGHLAVALSGLPLPASEHVLYRLWVASDEHDAAWVFAAELRPAPSGAASLQIDQTELGMELVMLRSAILTLEGHGDVGPGSAIILAGAASEHEDEETPAAGGDGGGGHTH